MALTSHAHAHGFAGDHMFISTLLIDDPNVADEASLPTFQFLPSAADGGGTSFNNNLGFEFDKRITENFGFAINDGYTWLTQPGAKTANGWNNIVVTLKYKPYVNAEHEFMLSVGVQRVMARSGANGTNGAVLDNDDSSSTIPTIYFGKGFGDIPVGWIRPFALTGELGYQIADTKLKVDPVAFTPINNGISNGWTGGLSLQYSIRYLSAQVKDYGLPDFVNKLTPVVELSWSSSASQPNPGRHAISVGCRRQLHRHDLRGRPGDADPWQQQHRLPSGSDCPVPSLFRRPVSAQPGQANRGVVLTS